jgi:hypothetical protein
MRIFVVITLTIYLLINTSCKRSNSEMQAIAIEVYNNHLKNLDSASRINASKSVGPQLISQSEDDNTYMWQQLLEFNDTAKFYVTVYRSKFDSYGYNAVASDKWFYLIKNNYLELVLKNLTDSTITEINSLKIKIDTTDAKLIISKSKIQFLLKNSFFKLHYVTKNVATIEFWEPFAANDSMRYRGAQVFSDEKKELIVIPYDLPDSIIAYRYRYPAGSSL